MKTTHWLFLTVVASLGFGGCCTPPNSDTPLPPAVVITPAPGTHTGHGKGFLKAHLVTRCLPADVIVNATLIVDGARHPFAKTIELKAGKHVLKFPNVVGFLTPPVTEIEITRCETTEVTVTYNRRPRGPASGGHHPRTAMLTPLDPGVSMSPNSGPTGSGTGHLLVQWAPIESGLHPQPNLWWINSASKQTINNPSPGMPVTAGPITVNFEPLAGYTKPNPTPTRVWRGTTTTLTVTYGHP